MAGPTRRRAPDDGTGRSAGSGIAVVVAGSIALTVVMAWPVVRAPSERIFGHESVGRHHDPLTVMWRFLHAPPPAPYRQPLVDDVGAAVADPLGPVAAFNLLVLLTFPLSAAAAYALARFLHASHAGALVAGFAFAFAPYRLAHAAYHPHIVQTHWIPLYLLALWACLERGTLLRCVWLAAAAAGLALSNLYGAFIAAVLTPVSIAAWWRIRVGRALAPALATLGLALTAAVGTMALAAPAVLYDRTRFAFDFSDLERDGARWRAYLLPPVDHPLLGEASAGIWTRAGLSGALIEQQISPGIGLLLLAGVAVLAWARHTGRGAGPAPMVLRAVPALLCVAAWAAVCSLAPAGGGWGTPAAWLYPLAPMFRAYARFGIAVQLTVAILAGLAVTHLLATFSPASAHRATLRLWARPALAAILLGLVVFEYAPLPWRSRDVLPTSGHRWLAGQTDSVRALDCVRPHADFTIPSLMGRDLGFLSDVVASCEDPEVPARLAALGYTHMIVRAGLLAAPWAAGTAGLRVVEALPDATVLAVTAPAAPVVQIGSSGFFPADPGMKARWMGQWGSWTIRNTTTVALPVVLELTLSSFAHPRTLALSLDGERIAAIHVSVAPAAYRLDPLVLTPGDHRLALDALEPATTADTIEGNGDSRGLTILLSDVRWDPALLIERMEGFFDAERQAGESWRWMPETGTIVVHNPTPREVIVMAEIELAAFGHDRGVAIALDGVPVGTFVVKPSPARVRFGPLVVTAGRHELTLAALEPATVGDDLLGNGDRRALAIRILGEVRWTLASFGRKGPTAWRQPVVADGAPRPGPRP